MQSNRSRCYVGDCSLPLLTKSCSAAGKHPSAKQQKAIYIHQLVVFASQFITSCHFLFRSQAANFEWNGQHTNRMRTHTKNQFIRQAEVCWPRNFRKKLAGVLLSVWKCDHLINTLSADGGKWKPFRWTESDVCCLWIPDDRVQVWLPVPREFPTRRPGVPAVAARPHPRRRQLLVIIAVWKQPDQKQRKGQWKHNGV